MQETNSLQQTPVKFRFKNIGPVTDAELELGDLTLIAGRNNTGKTYIVYTLYGFLKMWRGWSLAGNALANEKYSDAAFPDIKKIAQELSQEGRASFPLNRTTLAKQRKIMIGELALHFSKNALPDVFSSQPSDFENASFEVITSAAHSATHPISETFRDKVTFQEGVSLLIEYDGSSVVVSTDKLSSQGRIPNIARFITYHYFLFLLQDQFPEPFILSAERFGISLFYRELDFTKNQLVDILQKWPEKESRDGISPILFIDKTTSRYALPIKENIDYTRDIPNRQKTKSGIYEDKLFDGIKNLMEGYYRSSGDDIRFISKARGKGRRFNIPLHLASSSVRGLSDLYFFLRHVARKNQLLIIDEPESHLDTPNQILLARLLARFVRAGLKVLVTTHSDYLIKEINNLVMLSKSFADKNAVVKKFKYSSDDFLDPDSVRAYVAEDNSLKKCEVDRFGIDIPVFDKTIDRINEVANELASRLEEDPEA